MIASLSVQDSDLLTQIHLECFDNCWSSKSFSEMLSRKTFFGFIHKEKEAQGFILGKIVGDEIEIITFCVLPRFQNSGIGKMLVDKIDDYAKIHSVHRIFLEVSENNTVAKNIYKGFGYKEISKRIKYYPTGDCLQNAIIMRKDIIPNSIIK